MNDRRSLALTVAMTTFACAALVGCAPDAAPTPTPQATFATEEEAFAAAEAVYREYVDASNNGDDGLQFLAGDAYESALETRRLLEAEKLRTTGETVLVSFAGNELATHGSDITVVAELCIDVTATSVRNESDEDVTPVDRASHWFMEVEFNGPPGALLVTRSNALTSGAAC